MNDRTLFRWPRTVREAGLEEDPLRRPLLGSVQWFLLGTAAGIFIAIIAIWSIPA